MTNYWSNFRFSFALYRLPGNKKKVEVEKNILLISTDEEKNVCRLSDHLNESVNEDEI